MDKEFLENNGYMFPRQLDDGTWIAIYRFITTWGLVIGIDEIGYSRRFCYHDFNHALKAVANWDGKGDPPGNWIVEKPGNRQGPGSRRVA